MNLNIVLVGSNPLPCYIGAAYVLQKERELADDEEKYLPVPEHILFVVTKETEEFAENIQKLIMKHQKNGEFFECAMSFCSLENGRDAHIIESRLEEKLNGILAEKEYHHIVLNDTGGTKMMTVHAALLCRSYAKEHSVRAVECYVDPDENRLRCLCFNDGNMELYPKTGMRLLQDQIRMSVEELIRLHYGNEAVIKDRNDEVDEEDFEENIRELCGTDQISFIRISERILNEFEIYKEFYRIWNRKGEPANKRKALGNKNAIVELFNCIDGTSLLTNSEVDDDIFTFWGRGEWLELYFYLALRQVKQKLGAEGKHFELVWSCKVWKKKGNKEFEVDIVTVRGFLLTLYSLTMAEAGETGLAKGKWFEAVYRTDQMGGGHGKTELVCLLSSEADVYGLQRLIEDLKRSETDRSIEIKTIESLKSYKKLTDSLMNSIQ